MASSQSGNDLTFVSTVQTTHKPAARAAGLLDFRNKAIGSAETASPDATILLGNQMGVTKISWSTS